MNNAERNIYSDVVTGALAEITRIGSGEVRAYDAWADPAAAWDTDDAHRGAELRTGRCEPEGADADHAGRHGPELLGRADYLHRQDQRSASRTTRPLARSRSRRRRLVYRAGAWHRDFPVTMTIDGDEGPGQCDELGRRRRRSRRADVERDRRLPDARCRRPTVASHPPAVARPAAQGRGRDAATRRWPSTAAARPPSTLHQQRRGHGAERCVLRLLAVSPNLPQGGPRPRHADSRHPRGGHQHLPGAGRVLLCQCDRSSGRSRSTPGSGRRTCLPVAHVVSLDTNRDGTWDYDVVNLDRVAR